MSGLKQEWLKVCEFFFLIDTSHFLEPFLPPTPNRNNFDLQASKIWRNWKRSEPGSKREKIPWYKKVK